MTGPHKSKRLFDFLLAYRSSVVKLRSICDDDVLCYNPNDVEVAADKIDRLLNDKELEAKLIEAQNKQAENYSFRKSAKSHLDIIEGLN